MLRDQLYTTAPRHTSENEISVDVVLNPKSNIFEGHFPGNPILPGVCMIEIMREVLEDHLKMKMKMTSASNIKFTAVLNPEIHGVVVLNIQYQKNDNDFLVKSTLKAGELSFFNFSGALQSE